MQRNGDGFVMIGSLTCPHRPFIRFLFVDFQPPMVARSFDESVIGRDKQADPRKARKQSRTLAGFLPTVRYLPAVALVSYLIHDAQWMYHQTTRPPFSYRGLTPHKTHAMPGVPIACTGAAVSSRFWSQSQLPPPRDAGRSALKHR